MAKQPYTISQFSLTVETVPQIGKIKEVKLPDLTMASEDIRPGGYYSDIEIHQGLEKMEATFELFEHSVQLHELCFERDGGLRLFTFRGYSVRDNGEWRKHAVFMRGRLKQRAPNAFSAGQIGSLTYTMTPRYYREVIEGSTVAEIDIVNHKMIIGGRDLMSDMRSALAL
jgi:P2 family phage contractile tail tube protein